jgi:penicillin-binding protein 1A
MKVALKGKPESELKQPENVVAVRIDPSSGLLARPNQANGIIEYFRDKEVPAEEDPTLVYNASNEQEQLPPVEESLF